MSDEEFVRAHWKHVNHTDDWQADMMFFIRFDGIAISFCHDAPEPAWSAAAEFTRERLEQIRQVRREVERTQLNVDDYHDSVIAYTELRRKDWNVELAIEIVRGMCAECRTLFRLESALADLQRGMKA